MSYFNVVKPCVVGQLHYARPTAQPIEVDDEVAAPLVESGCLAPYGHGLEDPNTRAWIGSALANAGEESAKELIESIAASEDVAPAPRSRGRRRTEG